MDFFQNTCFRDRSNIVVTPNFRVTMSNSETVVNIFLEAATHSLKNIEMFPEAAIQSST